MGEYLGFHNPRRSRPDPNHETPLNVGSGQSEDIPVLDTLRQRVCWNPNNYHGCSSVAGNNAGIDQSVGRSDRKEDSMN